MVRTRRAVIESNASKEKRLHGVKQPMPCEYNCGRTVYTVYPVATCNVCRRARGIPIFNR